MPLSPDKIRHKTFGVFLATVLVVMSNTAQAQDVYTVGNLPKPGTRYNLQLADTSGVDRGLPGMNQLWNFENLVPIPLAMDSVRTVSINDIKGTKPPGANVVIINTTRSDTSYYNTTKPSLRFIGETDPIRSMYAGSNPLDIEPVPCRFMNTITDVYTASIVFSGNPQQSARRTDTVRFTPDGTGKISLPGGIAGVDVIRVSISELINDSVFRAGQPQYVARTQRTTTRWYGAQDDIIYLEIIDGSVVHEQILAQPPPDSAINIVRFLVPGSAASSVIDLEATEVSIKPNPASEVVTLTFNDQIPVPVNIRILSVQGKELFTAQLLTDDNSELSISTSKFPLGEYAIVISRGSEVSVKKLIILR
jgi:hypothetical protein